jgi:hypothetical protein
LRVGACRELRQGIGLSEWKQACAGDFSEKIRVNHGGVLTIPGNSGGAGRCGTSIV